MNRKMFIKGISFYLIFFSLFGLGQDPSIRSNKKISAKVTGWLDSAKRGDKSVYLSLFSAFCKGDGVQRDKTEAAKWFEKYQKSELENFDKLPGPKGSFDRGWSTPMWLEGGCDIGSIQ